MRDPKIKDAYSREFSLESGNEIVLKSRMDTLSLKNTIFEYRVEGNKHVLFKLRAIR